METAIRLARQACRSEKTQGLGRKRRNKYREEALSRVAGQTERLGISRPDRSAISPPCGTVTCSGSTIDPREANGIGSPGCKGIAEMRLMPGCLVLAVLGLCPASLRAAGGEQTPGLLEPLKPITSISTSIQPQRGRLPTDHAGQVDLQRAASSAAARPPRGWTGFCWTAPGVCHRPLYFEDAALERHGYSLGLGQPVASTVHFVGNLAILPYRLAAEPTSECVYVLGHERPGTPTPLRYYRPPLRISGGLAEAGVAAGLVFLLP
jgi:hypothetical protein